MHTEEDVSVASDVFSNEEANTDISVMGDLSIEQIKFLTFLHINSPHLSCFTPLQAVELLSAFTDVPKHHVAATVSAPLRFSSTSAKTTCNVREVVTRARLLEWFDVLTRALADLDAWWEDPGVHLHDDADDVSTTTAESPTTPSKVPQKTPPSTQPFTRAPSSWESPRGRTEENCTELALGGGGTWRSGWGHQISAFPASVDRGQHACNNWQGVRLRELSATFEQAVEKALRELGEGPDFDYQASGGVITRHQTATDAQSSAYTPASSSDVRCFSRYRPAPRPTNALPFTTAVAPPAARTGLEGFVQRGRDMKVCRQFMETGRCSYGARCLFHHPDFSTAASAGAARKEGHVATTGTSRGTGNGRVHRPPAGSFTWSPSHHKTSES